ncbi:MAG: lysophospholipid acyltransferase family protein [Kiritimatiellae bacterium]|nr:lysophospholipid acyltransferase family protein [Kiritimatiellia bacterium]
MQAKTDIPFRKRFKRKLRRPLEWFGIWLGVLCFSYVSHRTLFKLCDLAAAVMYAFDSKGRALAEKNLKRIFSEKPLSKKRSEIIIRASYRNMARTIGHIFWTSRKAKERAAEVAEMTDECRAFLKENRPAVTVSAHLGCWEVLSQLVYLERLPIMSVAKDIGSAAMTSLLMKSRKSLGQEIVHAEGAFRPLMQALKDGTYVGLLVDQVVKAERGGIWVRYFSTPVPVSVAPAFLAAKAKVPTILAWCRPLKNGHYRCECIKQFPVEKKVDIWGRTQEIMTALEKTIRRHPSCWVLNYRYFRYVPTAEELAQLEERERALKGEG